ncbi:MAG: AtpZ/AtpI family protein [Flavobacteriales bacterium]|nr:AtpZ/AtpI family protein [Flavobacteriales bacterium]
MAAAPGHRPSDPARKGVHAYLRYSALGLQMAGIILLSIWAGRWLDGRVDTGFPAFTLVFALLGIAGAMVFLFKETGR